MIVPFAISKLPVPVMLFEFKSKFPPSWGVVSSTTFAIPGAIDVQEEPL